MSDFVENVVLTLEKYDKMKKQIEELTSEKIKNEKLIEKFYRPFVENNITKEQFKDVVKQLENTNFTINVFEDVDAKSQKIRVMLELDKKGVMEDDE